MSKRGAKSALLHIQCHTVMQTCIWRLYVLRPKSLASFFTSFSFVCKFPCASGIGFQFDLGLEQGFLIVQYQPFIFAMPLAFTYTCIYLHPRCYFPSLIQCINGSGWKLFWGFLIRHGHGWQCFWRCILNLTQGSSTCQVPRLLSSCYYIIIMTCAKTNNAFLIFWRL